MAQKTDEQQKTKHQEARSKARRDAESLGDEQQKQEQKRIAATLGENMNYLNELFGVGESFDVIGKEYHFDDFKVACYCINGFFMTNQNILIVRDISAQIAQYFKDTPKFEPNDLVAFLNTHLPFVQVSIVDSMENAILQILSGPMVLFVDGYSLAIAIDQRVYPGRSPAEPETERVIRGPRDGFTETLLTNTALTRRRVRDPNLRMEIMQVGRRSKTDICVAYIKNVTDEDLVREIKEKLQAIDTDGIPMAEQSLDEYLVKGTWNPFPKVRYTERPDVAAVHLLQGHVLIFVDTSPEVIIAPTTFFHHLHHPEDYHLRPLVGTYMRWATLAAILVSIFLPAVWLELAMNAHALPYWLDFMKPKKVTSHIPLSVQVLIVEIGIDVFRRAVVNSPVPVASAIGLVAGLVFGQLTVQMGIVSADAMIYISLATVGAFATSSPELASANRMVRISLIVLVGVFHIFGLGVLGLGIGVLFWLILLGRTNTFGIPYLWPMFPLNLRGMTRILIREPVSTEMTRPAILNVQDESKK